MANATESTRVRPQSPLPTGWDYAYAYIFFIGIFLAQTIRFFVGSDPLIGAQSAQIVIPLIAVLVSSALWLASPVPIRLPSGLLAVFFGLLIFIWLWALISDWGATDLTSFTLGPFLAMFATKTPAPACAIRILDTLGVLCLMLFASAFLFAAITNVPPTGFTTKWPPLTNSLDPIGMWWAPFNGPAEAGAIGATLVILGAAQRNRLSIPFIVGGGVMLFYAGTFAAAVGMGVGLLIVFLGMARTSRHKRRIQFGSAVFVLVGLTVLAQELVRNPSLSSRAKIWSDFLQILESNFMWGIGSRALIAAEREGVLPNGGERLAHGSDAHNLLLDAWVRHGVVFLIAVVFLLVLGLVLGLRAWSSHQPLGLALVSMLVTVGITESNIWWGVPSSALALFILATLVGQPPSQTNLGSHV